jgi:hypothetical protein
MKSHSSRLLIVRLLQFSLRLEDRPPLCSFLREPLEHEGLLEWIDATLLIIRVNSDVLINSPSNYGTLVVGGGRRKEEGGRSS